MGTSYGIRKISVHAAKHLFDDEKEIEITNYKISKVRSVLILLFTTDR